MIDLYSRHTKKTRKSSKTKAHRNRLKRKRQTDRTFCTNVGRQRTAIKTLYTVPKAPGVVNPSKRPKAVTVPGPHENVGWAKGRNRGARLAYKRYTVDPNTIENYWPVYSLRGEYYGYVQDNNGYSADGSSWLFYFRWAHHWAEWNFYAMDNFAEGVINQFHIAGASSGPNRRYQLLTQPAQPVRPPVPPCRPHQPQRPRWQTPENMWDLEFWWMGRRVGPGDMCRDPLEPEERRKDFAHTRLHPDSVGSFGGDLTP